MRVRIALLCTLLAPAAGYLSCSGCLPAIPRSGRHSRVGSRPSAPPTLSAGTQRSRQRTWVSYVASLSDEAVLVRTSAAALAIGTFVRAQQLNVAGGVLPSLGRVKARVKARVRVLMRTSAAALAICIFVRAQQLKVAGGVHSAGLRLGLGFSHLLRHLSATSHRRSHLLILRWASSFALSS